MAKHDPSLDHVFTALGDPTRRAILEHLSHGPASVSELAAPFDMAMPSFMAHLKKLEAAGMIASDKAGRVRTCALVPGAFAPARDWLTAQKALWEARLDRFDAFVTQLSKEQTK
ncbi:ArsR/SmtB family transcription factor [Pseudooceanicola sp. C21-150M6]|uniref:ArsR/SmtB family transcription factor n=1 Tax=Pseudooceanicola sp. C21-150M6 TaxID=3434355 RepID=UPI003D7F707A